MTSQRWRSQLGGSTETCGNLHQPLLQSARKPTILNRRLQTANCGVFGSTHRPRGSPGRPWPRPPSRNQMETKNGCVPILVRYTTDHIQLVTPTTDLFDALALSNRQINEGGLDLKHTDFSCCNTRGLGRALSYAHQLIASRLGETCLNIQGPCSPMWLLQEDNFGEQCMAAICTARTASFLVNGVVKTLVAVCLRSMFLYTVLSPYILSVHFPLFSPFPFLFSLSVLFCEVRAYWCACPCFDITIVRSYWETSPHVGVLAG